MKTFLTSSFFILTSSLLFAFGPGDWNPGGGGGQQPGSGNQPEPPGGGEWQPGGSFIYDTFITDSTGVDIDVRNGIWISTDRTTSHVVSNSNLVQMAVGAAAGSVALTNVDLRMSASLTEIPACAFAGCENLETVILPTSVTNVAADAFIGCPKFGSVSYVDASVDSGTLNEDRKTDGKTQDVNFENELIEEVTDGDSILPLAYGIAEPVDAGRVTGATRKAAGKTVTLKAKANSGYVFIGWYDGDACLTQTTTLKFTMPNKDVCYTARFVTKAADASAISCSLAECDLSSEVRVSVSNTCGVRVTYPIAASGLSKVTVVASGLPSGLKLVRDKSTGTYSVEGIPTRAATKNTKFTVTSAGKSKRTFVVNWIVGSLPVKAVGTWNGIAEIANEDETAMPIGNFTMKATAAGAVSAKTLTSVGTVSFSGKGWIEDENGILWITMTNKTYTILCIRLNPQTDWTEDSLTAEITSGKFEKEFLRISAYRNPYGKKGRIVENTDAQNVMLAVVGTWPINVIDQNSETLSGVAKIQKTGRVKVTGKLANGNTSYSMSGVLEIRYSDEVLIPTIRLVGITKYGCLWCNEEVLK